MVELSSTRFGQDHPDTLTLVNNLGYLHFGQKRYDLAERLFLETIHRSHNNSAAGSDHDDDDPTAATATTSTVTGGAGRHLVTALRNLGSLYARQQRYDDAEPIYEECLEHCIQEYGDRHEETITALGNLALLCKKTNQITKATKLYERLLGIQAEERGEDHPFTLAVMGNLASLYALGGRHVHSEGMFLKFLPKVRKVLGQSHPDTILAMQDLGCLYHQQDRLEEAEPLYQECMMQTMPVLGWEVHEQWMDLYYKMSYYKPQDQQPTSHYGYFLWYNLKPLFWQKAKVMDSIHHGTGVLLEERIV
jgi:tetratricopeptide (TPR) repeat protein